MKPISLILALLLCLCLCPAARAEGETPAPEVFTCGDYEYILLEDGTAQITKYKGNGDRILLPLALNGISVTGIGDRAFSQCETLTAVAILSNVVSLGINPFENCKNLTTFQVSSEHPTLAVIDGVLFEKVTKTLICYPMGKTQSSYAVPQGILTIGSSAFYGNFSLTAITIPDSVTFIGDYAFYWCSALTDLTIPDSVTTIGDFAIAWCPRLVSVTIPDSVISLGSNPLENCMSLTTIRVSPDHPALALNDGVLFEMATKTLVCYPVGKVQSAYTIPQGVRRIGRFAFSTFESLNSVTIPDSVTTIDECAFYRCSSLNDVTIPDSVTTIGNWAFYGCSGLTSIIIPDSVTAIGEWVFYGCNGLTATVGRDSYAEQYCKDNGIPYVYPDSNDWLNH